MTLCGHKKWNTVTQMRVWDAANSEKCVYIWEGDVAGAAGNVRLKNLSLISVNMWVGKHKVDKHRRQMQVMQGLKLLMSSSSSDSQPGGNSVWMGRR